MTLSWAEAFNKTEPRPEATVTPITPPGDGTLTPYAAKALANELDAMRTATEGSRNDQLNRSTFALAQLVAAGHLTEHLVRDELTTAATAAGLGRSEIDKTLGSGLRSGTQHPRQVELRPEPAANVVEVDPARFGQPAATPVPDPEQRARTSWWAEPVDTLIANSDAVPLPDVLVRTDDHGLFYRGMTNGLIGESESGKSWVALHGLLQDVAAGGRGIILDFEDTARTARERLTALGCTPEGFSRIRYASPDQALDTLASADVGELLATFNPSTVVVDGVNAAMTLLGLDLNSNTDATVFYTKLLRPIATAGACVITVDHVPKNPEQRGKGGIGAQAKRAMISGCALRVEVSEPFGRGQSGKLKLYIDKDRPGHVRGHAGSGKYAGTFIIESAADRVRTEIEPPRNNDEWRPTHLMERISSLLENGGATSKNGIEIAVRGDRNRIREALACLIQDGHVTTENGPRGSILCRLIKPFSASVTEAGTEVPGDA